MSDTIARLAAAASPPRTQPSRTAESAPRRPFLGPDPDPEVAVVIPCFNEEATIAKVVADFRAALPDAVIYVYDNNSTDGTALAAIAAGAIVRGERLQGKGHVVRRMFADVDADVLILVDGDDTYDASAAPMMVRRLRDRQLDMVTAVRATGTGPGGQGRTGSEDAYRLGHQIGNAALTGIVRWVFGTGVSDLLSGYRVFSHRFARSFPALAPGFETETEFTVHALALHMPIEEVQTAYRGRPPGSRSKLNTARDGLRILCSILGLIQRERPLPWYTALAMLFLSGGLGLGFPVVIEFLRTGLVPRFPTAMLATGLTLLAFLSLTCGLLLDAVTRGRREFRRLAYLAVPARRRGG